MLKLDGVTKSYGDLRILAGIGFCLDPGATLALVGESGSGKSTLLHLVAGLDTPDSGSILLDGTDIAALSDPGRAEIRRTRVGVVFQQFNLVQSLTVADNIALHARLAGRWDAGRTEHVTGRLGLAGLGGRYPEQISGGQQQRVAIARALAAAPALLLADEPTGNLDEATGDRVLDLMMDLVAELGLALVFVTHSRRLASRLDRTLTLHAGKLS